MARRATLLIVEEGRRDRSGEKADGQMAWRAGLAPKPGPAVCMHVRPGPTFYLAPGVSREGLPQAPLLITTWLTRP